MVRLDETDYKILKLLQSNARMPVKSIAEQVFVSAPTVSARIEAMRKEGVIKGFYTEINPMVFGNTIRAFIDVEVAPSGKSAELYDWLRANPQVVACTRVTGEYSLLIEVILKDTEDMDKFINHMQRYGRTKTQIVFSSVLDHRGVIIE